MKQQIPWPLRWAAASTLSVATMGCGLIQAAVQANEDDRLEALEAEGDYEALAETCRKPQHYQACEAMNRVGLARLAASRCDALVENTKTYYRNSEGTETGDVELVKRFHACKLTHELFAQSFEVRYLSEALTALDKGGADVFDRLIAYLASADGAFAGEEGIHRGRNVAEWLIDAGDASRCATVNAHVSNVAPEGRGELIWYFYEAGCGEQAVPMALERLTSDEPNARMQACDVLGKFGDVGVVDKLETLAETDPHKQEREVRMPSGVIGIELFHPVRERCLEAAGKVRLRS